jgi:hypothetical protein
MIAAFLRRLIGLAPPAAPSPAWVQELQDYSYRVQQDEHGWYWSRRTGAFSGHYTTEQGAWAGAWAKHRK